MDGSIPRYLQQWVRELLGTREYMRAISTEGCRLRLVRLVDAIEGGRVDRAEVRAAFSRAGARRAELVEIFDELENPKAARPKPAQPAGVFHGFVEARINATAPPPARPAVAGAGEAELRELRREMNEQRRKSALMERLLREVTAQVVLDAARLRGFEAALNELNKGSRKRKKIESAFQSTTGQFFTAKVFPFIQRLRRTA